MSEHWIDQFRELNGLGEDARKILSRECEIASFRKGAEVFGYGNVPDKLFLVMSGGFRVFRTSESGREIVLYRVNEGEGCILSKACLMAQTPYSAQCIAETDARTIAIPGSVFDKLLAISKEFREYAFGVYSRRMLELFRVIDDVAFGRIDVRLAERLISLASDGTTVEITHQELAVELGTAREVVSRQLNDFQKRGLIALSRGRIQIVDGPALRHLSER